MLLPGLAIMSSLYFPRHQLPAVPPGPYNPLSNPERAHKSPPHSRSARSLNQDQKHHVRFKRHTPTRGPTKSPTWSSHQSPRRAPFLDQGICARSPVRRPRYIHRLGRSPFRHSRPHLLLLHLASRQCIPPQAHLDETLDPGPSLRSRHQQRLQRPTSRRRGEKHRRRVGPIQPLRGAHAARHGGP